MAELLFRFGKRWRSRTIIAVAFKVVEVVFDLMTPLLIARMIDTGVANHDIEITIRLGCLLALLAITGFGFTLVCQREAAIISQGMGTELRDALFQKTNSLSAAELDSITTASLITRVTSDVNQVQLAVALGVRQLVRWPFLACGSMIAAMLIDWRLGLIFFVCTPCIALVFWLVVRRSVPLYTAVQQRLDAATRIARESLSGARVIRAFGRESREEQRFHNAAYEHANAAIETGRLAAILNPASLFIMQLGVVTILWIGGWQVNSGALTTGEVMAFVTYMTQTMLAIAYVANLAVVFTKGAASAHRIMEVLTLSVSVTNKPDENLPLELLHANTTNAIAFDKLYFTYPNDSEAALCNINAHVLPGETLGIIGGTGSGKSTLVALLTRMYDPSNGQIFVFGHDVSAYPLSQLRRILSVVPQQVVLMRGTIRTNLCWRHEAATDEELWSALEIAQAASFVRAKPLGLDEPVEAGGRNFSGGQRQRLTIARALIGSPNIIVLDDSASALDLRTDARLRKSLKTCTNLTKVIISQRVSAIADADHILVLNHGRIAGQGSHEELLNQCTLYREIVASQLAGDQTSIAFFPKPLSAEEVSEHG